MTGGISSALIPSTSTPATKGTPEDQPFLCPPSNTLFATQFFLPLDESEKLANHPSSRGSFHQSPFHQIRFNYILNCPHIFSQYCCNILHSHLSTPINIFD